MVSCVAGRANGMASNGQHQLAKSAIFVETGAVMRDFDLVIMADTFITGRGRWLCQFH